jgi:hypothetical protein
VILNEFCTNTGYNRKYAIRLLNGPRPEKRRTPPRQRGVSSDNGSEFINWHLKRWCEQKDIQLTRGTALQDIYHELRLWLNLFLPSVKLLKKVRVGSKVRRVYNGRERRSSECGRVGKPIGSTWRGWRTSESG